MQRAVQNNRLFRNLTTINAYKTKIIIFVMNVEPLQILYVNMYSKIVGDMFTPGKMTIPWSMIFLLAAFHFKDDIVHYVKSWINGQNNSGAFILIPQHKKTYYSWTHTGKKETHQTIFSKRFKALTYRLIQGMKHKLSSTIEVMSADRVDTYMETDVVEYILLPSYNQKIMICQDRGIYFEILIQQDDRGENKDGGSNKKSTAGQEPASCMKMYTYKLSIADGSKYEVLEKYMDECVEEYEIKVLRTNEQIVFEFTKSYKDEYDKSTMQFRQYPFKSTKHLDKNIFFEGRDKFIEYVDQFAVTKAGQESRARKDYADMGVTFKASIVMHGPPGCGKSSIIRGILNRTGRHGVLIQWSRIKTCSDFCNLFWSLTINNTKYELDKVCMIFEDFDANQDEVLKSRKSTKLAANVSTVFDEHASATMLEPVDLETIDKDKTKAIIEALQAQLIMSKQKGEDELTLECVLNVLDGIIELHGGMVIFTTNHLENIDPAFLRSGRIDHVLELKLATVAIIREMVEYRYRGENIEWSNYLHYFDKMKDGVVSPADIQSVLFRHRTDDLTSCLNEIQRLAS